MNNHLDMASDKLQLFCERKGKPYLDFVNENHLQSYLTNLSGIQAHVGHVARAVQYRQNEGILRCMVELHDVCSRLGIRYAFMKGLCVATLLYDVREARSFGDVDILVSPGDAKALTCCLLQEGFKFEVGVDPEAGINRLNNGHHHMKQLFKNYNMGSYTQDVTLEIHGFPNDCGYELYGESAYDVRFTDELLTRREVIRIDGCEVYTLGKTDHFYQLLLHAASHLALDTALYLYVNKPFQSTSALPWLIDLALFAARFRDDVDWNAIMALAERQNSCATVSWLLGIVAELFDQPALCKPGQDRKTDIPLEVVSRIYAAMDPADYLLFHREQPLIDRLVKSAVRDLGDRTIPGVTMERDDEKIHIAIAPLPEGETHALYSVQITCVNDRCDDFCREVMVQIAENRAIVYRDNGYRLVWDPATFGTLRDEELDRCYDIVVEMPLKRGEHTKITITQSDVGFSLVSARILVQKVESFNPFRNRRFGL